MTILPIALALVISVIGVTLFARAVGRIIGVVKVGQPTLGRSDHPASRWRTLLIESFGHTRMVTWTKVGIAHWFVFVGFMFLFFTLVTAFGQLFAPHFALPLVGHFFLYAWVTEALAWVMLACIVYLLGNRLNITGKNGGLGAKGRFFGSRDWQAYYVEFTILGIAVCILVLRALEFQLSGDRFHFPLSWFLLPPLSAPTAETAIVWVAALKIIVSMAWFCVIGLNTTMGVAWHRFTAWPNIWFKRESSGRTALGAIPPVNVGGTVPDLIDEAEVDEDVFARLGVGAIEDFSWKGLLDFTSCTECGRCQSQCPAWNTEKPLSPKLLVMGLREHAYAKAPYLQAAESARGSLAPAVLSEAERPLVGATVGPGGDTRLAAAAQAHGNPISIGADGSVAVVDPDVLWSCTSCGACVQQCPVDIEHVDHIMDMRRFQVMVAGEFPSELNGLYKGLESKGNPWNMNRRGRLDWAKDLPFDVPVVGESVTDLTEVEYLFWVGCAGAYEDRAKKTTRAVAELLDTAGVSFAVLGNGETCTGDPARRAGNEMVFQQLAAENRETLTEAKASKVVTTCAHCLNTLKNEYPQIGVELEVVHHTQLLNRLVREGRLTPVAAPSGSVAGRTITYHDPCYLGRHNQVYDAPRDLLGAIPGATYAEMPRAKETSFCCGAGGARMWMEEKTGTRINANRTSEALTVLGQAPSAAVATGCPFCRVMLSDGLTAEQAEGRGENVEVLDVAQLLLEGVHRDQPGTPAERAQRVEAPEPTPAERAQRVEAPEPVPAERAQRVEAPEPVPAERAERVEAPEPVRADHAEEAAEAKKQEAGVDRSIEQAPADEVDTPGEAPQVKGGAPVAPKVDEDATGEPVAKAEPAAGAQPSLEADTTPNRAVPKAVGVISLKDLASKAKGGTPAAAPAEPKDAEDATPAPKYEATAAEQAKDECESEQVSADTHSAEAAQDEATTQTGRDSSDPSDAKAKSHPGGTAPNPVGAISLKDLAAKAKGQTTEPSGPVDAASAQPEATTEVTPPLAPAGTAPEAATGAEAISLSGLAALAKGGSAPPAESTETASRTHADPQTPASDTQDPKTEAAGSDAGKPLVTETEATEVREAEPHRAGADQSEGADINGRGAQFRPDSQRPASTEPTSPEPSGAAINLTELARLARERTQNE